MEQVIEKLHFVALGFMAVVYAIRIVWILRFRLARDLARPRQPGWRGAALAMTTALRPWSMESTRRGFGQWVEFWVFHVGVAVMIGVSFVLPFAPAGFTPAGTALLAATQVLALAAGLLRLSRRLRQPKLRAISSRDDYFSLASVNLLFAACALTLLGVPYARPFYFAFIALIIAYVPFSKISHYLYYPIARYFYGSHLGRRGVLR
jgi:nitrate reductase gamma subunit